MFQQKKPLVSIIIPVYNGANYMREAIDSAIAQTYDNIEIIVVNDGSTDNGETEQIALSYGDKIKYFRKENGGCASALNFGVEKMSGEFFSWLSHDDVYMPEKVEKSIQAYFEHHLDLENTVVMCKSAVINDVGAVIRKDLLGARGLLKTNDMVDLLLGFGNINGCALLIPKKILDDIGPFSTEYVYILDYMYWFGIALSGYDYFETADISVKNRRHEKQVSVQKHHLHLAELKRFISELVQNFQNNTQFLLKLWLYCRRRGFRLESKTIEKIVRIPTKLKISATFKRLLTFSLGVAKKIYRKLYGIGSFK